MPTNQLLTIGDVYKPIQAGEVMNVINTRQNLENSRIQNRLHYLDLGQKEYANQMFQNKVRAYGGPERYAIAQANNEKAMVEQEMLMKQQAQIKTAAETLKSLKTAFGRNNVVQNWDSIKGLHPLFSKMDPENITEDGYIVNNAEGKKIGEWIQNPEGGNPQFIPEPRETPTTETNARLWKEAQLRKEHPEWTVEQVKGEAANQIIKDRNEAKRENITFTLNQKEKKEIDKEARIRERGFHGLQSDEKAVVFFEMALKSKDPKLAWGDRQGYNDLLREYSRWKIDTLGDPGIEDVVRAKHPDWSDTQIKKQAEYDQAQKVNARLALMQTDYRAGDASVKNQKKVFDMMNGFVLNLNKQVVEVSKLLTEADRFGLKLASIPLVEVKKRIRGSGLEANIKSYLLEISNEIGKLSTGSAASVRELGENAQIKWEKIHDTTMPVSQLLMVLNTTRDQANLRIQSSQEAMDFTRSQISALGANPSNISVVPQQPAFDITRKPGETIPQFLERAKRGGK